MANPILNDKAFGAAATKSGATWAPPKPGVDWNPPITDGPVTTWQSADDRMTVSGTAAAAGVLLVLLLISASFGWAAVPDVAEGQSPTFPGIAMIEKLCAVESDGIEGVICGRAIYSGDLDFAAAQARADELA